jgi:N-acetylglucosaminyldiphosphoundecaprenol N-acetyl-beta-D-mannosaminyltransferase
MNTRTNILGVGVSAINLGMALETIDQWIVLKKPQYVCVTGVHGLVESYRDENLRTIHNEAGMVTPDGMPLVWISRAMGQKHVARVYGPDLMLATCKRSVSVGYRHFLYGGTPDVVEKLERRLVESYPGLQVVGRMCPPFRPLTEAEDRGVLRAIGDAKPHIVWVGLSTPKQERWMSEHVKKLDTGVLIGVGAAFDFLAGTKPQAPRWMRNIGLEWLFRLLMEPRRLWRRYLINNPLFVVLLIQQILRERPRFASTEP